MSLKWLLQNDSELKSFFKIIVPAKKDFKTISTHNAFSKEYSNQVPYNLDCWHNATVLGTAFDYVARWMINRRTIKQNEASLENLIAENALTTCEFEAKYSNIDIWKEWNARIDQCRLYMHGGLEINKIIVNAIFFAKLEQIYRARLSPPQVNIRALFYVEEDIFEELKALADVFKREFLDSGVVSEDSIVIYNPCFGGASVLCGGADADVFIDGVLYDFKCTKKYGYAWTEVAQIIGYFLLAGLADEKGDSSTDLHGKQIKRVAFYRARYGEIEYVDVDACEWKDKIKELASILGEKDYDEYLKEIEEEKKEIEFLKRKISILEQYAEGFSCQYNENGHTVADKQELERILFMAKNLKLKDGIDRDKLTLQMRRNAISVTELSKCIQKSQSAIRGWINGISNPNVGSFVDLVTALNCNPRDLLKLCRVNNNSANKCKKDKTQKKKKKRGKKRRRWK